MNVFCVLFWKHMTVRKRRIYCSFFEFISPSILIFIMYIQTLFENKVQSFSQTERFPIIEQHQNVSTETGRIFYLPSTTLSDDLMKSVGEKLHYPYREEIEFPLNERGMWSLKNESQLSAVYNNSEEKPFAIIEFKNLGEETWPSKLEYVIRLNRNFSTNSFKSKKDSALSHEDFGYVYRDFVALQWAVDSEFIERTSNKLIAQNLTYQHFPKLRFLKQDGDTKDDNSNETMYENYSIVVLLGLFPLLIIQTLRFSKEKSSGILELMKMSGVPTSCMIIAHIMNLLPALIIYIIVLVLSTWEFPVAHMVTFMLIDILYFFWIFFYAYFCSSVLENQSVVAGFATVSFFVLPSPNIIVNKKVKWEEQKALYILSDFIPMNPLYRIPNTVFWAKARIVHIVVMVLQVLFLYLMAEFIRAVRPGKYGIKKPLKEFLCCFKSNKTRYQDLEMASTVTDPHRSKYFEEPTSKMHVGIEVQNVSKVFGSGRSKHVALNNVNMKIYSGEITVLLGHNGAGKTTLMSIITGMYGATKGRVLVNGLDALANQATVRRLIGLCPQHNLYFDDLTVAEHFRFFAMLRGARFEQAENMSNQILQQLKLSEKGNSLCKTLSGGMKRRAQMGCALAGNPPILILDEPTSGLDVETRRELWNLMLSFRGTRTVLLTTHFMEEADALGDRMAALHSGEVRCHATPMFLKKAIGSGYRLTLSLEEGYDAAAVTNVVTKSVNGAQVRETSPTEMFFSLPATETQQFSQLFNGLEQQKKELRIRTMGVGITTLEEVFLNLCTDKTDEQEYLALKESDAQATTYKRVTGWPLQMMHLKALFVRQVKFYTNKSLGACITEILVPIAIALIFTYFTNGKDQPFPYDDDNPPLKLNLHVYDDLEDAKIFCDMKINNSDYLLEKFRKKFPGQVFVRSDNITRSILEDANSDIEDFNRMVIGLELDDDNANVMFTTKVRHALPVAVNMMTNLLAFQRSGDDLDPITITTVNHPVSNVKMMKKDRPILAKVEMMLYLLMIAFVLVASFILYPMVSVAIFERLTEARHIRIMAGVSACMYYVVMAFFQTAVYLIIIIPTFVLSALYLDMDDTVNNMGFVKAGIVLLTLNGLSFIVFFYVLSFFATEATATSIVSIVTVFFGVAAQLLRATVDAKFIKILAKICAVVPIYNFSYGMIKIVYVSKQNSLCMNNWAKCPNLTISVDNGFNGESCCAAENGKENGYMDYFPLDYEFGAGYEVIFMSVQILVLWVVVILLEKGIANKLWDLLWSSNYVPPRIRAFNDLHVIAEEKYVNTILNQEGAKATLGTDTMLVDNVHKRYYTFCSKYLAVKGVSFSVKKGECFGLLGVNGAGKSSMFKMLTATEYPTRGEIYANGFDRKTHMSKYLTTVTYCPQFGGLDDFLSGWDNVKLMCQLRGVPESHLKEEVNRWIQYVGLGKESKRLAGGYSGGCHRRCVTATCLAGVAGSGDRVLALLDEPTSGVDPAARRKVWVALKQSLRLGMSIIITSHSMDETESLCSRIAIMSLGEVGALGSTSELIESYGSGYTVKIKLHTGSSRASTSFPKSKSMQDNTLGSPAGRRQSRERRLSAMDLGQDGSPAGRRPSRERQPSVVELSRDRAGGSALNSQDIVDQNIQKIQSLIESTFQNKTLEDIHMSTIQYHIYDEISYSEIFKRMETIRTQLGNIIEDYTINGTTLEEIFLKFVRSESPSQAPNTANKSGASTAL